MHDPAESAGDGKLDLVPMIDCIMLLLLFFILTTRFTSDEKQLAALLPTNQGQGIPPKTPPVTPPKDVHLVVVPAGLPIGLSEKAYEDRWDEIERNRGRTPPAAELRIGGSDGILLDGGMFLTTDRTAAAQQVDAIHAYVASELTAREEPGERKGQSPITIHCFSGLSWGYALAVYDAVRAYEGRFQPSVTGNSSVLDDQQRPITFAPPRIRNVTARELGQELWELKHLK